MCFVNDEEALVFDWKNFPSQKGVASRDAQGLGLRRGQPGEKDRGVQMRELPRRLLYQLAPMGQIPDIPARPELAAARHESQRAPRLPARHGMAKKTLRCPARHASGSPLSTNSCWYARLTALPRQRALQPRVVQRAEGVAGPVLRQVMQWPAALGSTKVPGRVRQSIDQCASRSLPQR